MEEGVYGNPKGFKTHHKTAKLNDLVYVFQETYGDVL